MCAVLCTSLCGDSKPSNDVVMICGMERYVLGVKSDILALGAMELRNAF